MDEIQRLLAERACARLIVEYAHRLDFGAADTIWELFVADGVWEMPGEGLRWSGWEELRQGLPARLSDDRRTTRHICTNTAITVLGEASASGLTYMVNFRHDFGGPAMVDGARRLAPASLPRYIGEYIDTFVKTADGWRFGARRVELSFSHRAV